MVMNAGVEAGKVNGSVQEAHRINAELVAIQAARAELEIREVPLLQQVIALETFHVFGCVTITEYLERVLGYQHRTAQEKVRVARALVELPALRAALNNKQLAYWRVRELSRLATPATEAAWIDKTLDMDSRELEAFLAQHAKGDEPGKPTRADQRVKVMLELSPEYAEWWYQQRTRVAAELGEEITDDDVLASLREVDAGDAAGASAPIRTIIATCRDCKKLWQTLGGAERPADPVAVAMARCDSEHLGDVEADVPSRIRKTVSKRMRENVLARDGYRCAVPGCNARRHLDAHHLWFLSRGGPNKISNLLTLCSGHHRRLHDGQLTITGTAPHALEFTWTNPAAQARHAGIARATLAPPVDGLTDMQRLSRAIEEALS